MTGSLRREDDNLLQEIDFLIMAAEQAGDTRESIRLIAASMRNISAGLRGMGQEIVNLRADLARQTDVLSALGERLRALEGKVGEGSDTAEALIQLRQEWRGTKLLILGMFLLGGLATVCLVTLAILAQVYWVN